MTQLTNGSNRTISKKFIESCSVCEETSIIGKKGLIISLSYILGWVPTYIGNIVIGHYDNSELMLSGVGLSRTFCNVTAVSILWGLCSGLYTLVPQCIGSNRMDLLAKYIQRSFYLTLLCCIPLIILQLFCAKILCFIGLELSQDLQTIVNISCICFIPHILTSLWSTILRRIAQSMNYIREVLVCNIFTALISYPITYYLLYYCSIPIYISVPVSISICSFIKFTLILLILFMYGHSTVFKPIAMNKIFQYDKVKEYLLLSYPGIFKNSFEWWYYEIMVLLSGHISFHKVGSNYNTNIILASAIIIENMLMMVHLIAYGIGNSTSIRIGKYVGKNKLNEAKRSMKSGLIITVLTNIVLACIFYAYGFKITYLLTNNTDIIEIILKLIYVLIFTFTFILTLQLLSSIYRGIGKPKYSACIIFISYYMISLPIIIVLLFVFGKGMFDLFLMFGAANCIATVIMGLFVLIKINWNSVLNDKNLRLSDKSKKFKINNEKNPLSKQFNKKYKTMDNVLLTF